MHFNFFQILWKSRCNILVSFHIIWKNYVLYWDFDLKSWIVDFFTRFTREKTPQNNFFSQNFSVENNYFNFFWNLILNFRFMMYDCAAQTKKNDKRIISLHKHYRNKSRYNWQNDYERFFFNLHTPWKSNCFLPLHKKNYILSARIQRNS